jgi:hypothetical protein
MFFHMCFLVYFPSSWLTCLGGLLCHQPHGAWHSCCTTHRHFKNKETSWRSDLSGRALV